MASIKNNGLKWSSDDDKKLIEYYLNNKNYSKTATLLERTEEAVKARFVKIYVYPIYIRPSVYNDNNFNMKYFTKSYETIVNSYSKMFNIEKIDFVRFMKYADKNIQMFIKYTDPNYINAKNKVVKPIIKRMKNIGFKKVSDSEEDDSEEDDSEYEEEDDEDFVVEPTNTEILKKLDILNHKLDILLKSKY